MKKKYFWAGMITCLCLGWHSIAESGQDRIFIFDDWRVECTKTDTGEKGQCMMNQQGLDSKTGKMVYQVVIFPVLGNERPGLDVVVPLGILVMDGVNLEIESDTRVNMPVFTCVPKGCIARGLLEEPLDTAMRKGYKAKLYLKDNTGKEIFIPISLKGFRKAMEKFESKNKP